MLGNPFLRGCRSVDLGPASLSPCEKCRFSASTLYLLPPKLWGWGPATCDSDACWRMRVRFFIAVLHPVMLTHHSYLNRSIFIAVFSLLYTMLATSLFLPAYFLHFSIIHQNGIFRAKIRTLFISRFLTKVFSKNMFLLPLQNFGWASLPVTEQTWGIVFLNFF